jgi:hypothetical protein
MSDLSNTENGAGYKDGGNVHHVENTSRTTGMSAFQKAWFYSKKFWWVHLIVILLVGLIVTLIM